MRVERSGRERERERNWNEGVGRKAFNASTMDSDFQVGGLRGQIQGVGGKDINDVMSRLLGVDQNIACL